MTAWVVRGGAYEAEALAEGMMSVDWDIRQEVGQMTESNLRSLLEEIYRDTKGKAAITKCTREILCFRDRMALGDVIVMPLKKDDMAIGVVSREYEYLSKRPQHMIGRPVMWLTRGLPRSSVGEDLRGEMSYRQTVYELNSPSAEGRLRDIADVGPNRWHDFVQRAKHTLRRANWKRRRSTPGRNRRPSWHIPPVSSFWRRQLDQPAKGCAG